MVTDFSFSSTFTLLLLKTVYMEYNIEHKSTKR